MPRCYGRSRWSGSSDWWQTPLVAAWRRVKWRTEASGCQRSEQSRTSFAIRSPLTSELQMPRTTIRLRTASPSNASRASAHVALANCALSSSTHQRSSPLTASWQRMLWSHCWPPWSPKVLKWTRRPLAARSLQRRRRLRNTWFVSTTDKYCRNTAKAWHCARPFFVSVPNSVD